MNSLILDCSAGMNVLLCKGEEEYSYFDGDQKKHSDELLTVIDGLLKKASLKISDLENICVCTGPGSFTGLRVAISVCKGLAIGTGADVYALSNLDVFEFDKLKNSILVLDGFSQFVYIRKIENGTTYDACVSFDDLKQMSKEGEFKIYSANEKVQNRLNSSEIQSQIAHFNLKNAFLVKISKGEKINVNQIAPVYLRASQAEIERNKKLSGESK